MLLAKARFFNFNSVKKYIMGKQVQNNMAPEGFGPVTAQYSTEQLG
jgi:hypothetical protein